jgi:amino acid transporter
MVKKLGLVEVIAMGIGGMVSGGIFAVLGVAMMQAGNAVPISFLLAGILTLLTAYSYVKLTMYFKENGGAFSFIEHVVRNDHIAGFFGWVLIAGYIGVMAMYAFAFGAYFVSIFGIENVYLRPFVSVSIIFLLTGINLIGVKGSGLVEDILVYMKTIFLFIIAFVGIYFFEGSLPSLNQLFDKGIISPVAAFAIIFVAYEGFQLLCYDYKEIKNVKKNLKKGMYISIFLAIFIYISVSFMATLQITPEQAILHKEYALAHAVTPFLGSVGFALVVVIALQSTASGINATLFGTSRLSYRISSEEELPKVFSFRNKKNIPVYSLIIISGLTAILAAIGSLEQITQFGSITFIIADGAANYANIRLYKKTNSKLWIPLAGLIGCIIALPLVFYHLFSTDPYILASIVFIFLIITVMEFVYIKRRSLIKSKISL